MSQFFSVHTYTPWDGLKKTNLSQIRLLSLKNISENFPVIESAFFDDVFSKVKKFNHYSYVKCLKRILGPNAEDYKIYNWNFIWAMDSERRIYQLLFQRIKEKEQSKDILAALAPPELAKLFSKFGRDAILRTLSLLNNPSRIKFLMILGPKGKSIAEERQLFRFDKEGLDTLKYENILKNLPNLKGQWFPSYEPRCPICNSLLKGIENYQISFGKIICPNCGYEKVK